MSFNWSANVAAAVGGIYSLAIGLVGVGILLPVGLELLAVSAFILVERQAQEPAAGDPGPLGGSARADWGEARVTARDILDAADKSRPGEPGVLTKDHSRIEVQADGRALDIQVRDDWDKTVRIRLPRSIVESFSKESRVSPRDILHRLDDLGPGDVVSVHDRDQEVTITAEAK